MQVKCDELADAIKVGVLILDKNFKILDANREILLKGGVSKKDLIGTDFLTWFPEDRRNEIKKILEDTWNGKTEWGKGSFTIYSRRFKNFITIDLRIRRLEDNLVVTMIDKTWLSETLEKLNIIQTAVEHIPEGLIVTDIKGTIMYVNPGFMKITGYSYEETIGKNPRILKSGKQDRKFYENMWRTILSGEVWEGQLINRRKDGKLYWEEMTIVPIKDNMGHISNFVAVKRDITERKELELELQKREEYYRKIFSMSRDGIFIETLDGKLIDVNEAGAAMLGYTREELLKAGLKPIIPEEERKKFPQIVEELREKGEVRIEVLNKHKKGYLIPIELSLSLLNMDGREMFVAIARDLSLRNEMEEKYRILAQMAFDAVVLINDEGKVEYWNPAAERMFGYTQNEALHRPFWELIVPSSYMENKNFPELIKKGFRKRGFYTTKFEVEARRKDGKLISIELGISVFNVGGKKHALSVIRDVTERLEMERKIKRHLDELSTVHRFSLNLGSVTDLKDLSEKAYEEMKKLIPFDSFTIGFVNWEKGTIRYELMIHKGKNIGPVEIQLDPKNSLSGWIITNKKPLLIGDLEKDKDHLPSKWFKIGDLPRSWLGVPLIYQDRVVGVIILQSFTPNQYTQEDTNFLSILGAQLSLAIINSQLYTKLKLSEEKYRGIVESAIVGVLTVTLKGDIEFSNRKMADMLGYTPEELVRKNIFDLTTAEGKKIFERELKNRARGLSTYYENVLLSKEGEEKNVLISASPLHDEKGKIVGSVAVVVDITERKKKEFELIRRNRILNALYKISTGIGEAPELSELFKSVYREMKNIFKFDWFYIALYDPEKKELKYEIMKAGKKSLNGYILKYNPAKSLSSWVIKTGKPIIIRDLSKEKLPTGYTLLKEIEKCPPKSVIILPIKYENESLGVLSIQHKKANVYDEEDVKYLSTIANALAILIKNIQLFQETRTTKDRLETIINTSIVGIFTANLDGTLTYVNDKFAEFLGYSKDELIGKNIMELTTLEGEKIFKEHLKRKSEGISDYYENILIRRNGTKINVMINASPLKDAKRKIIGCVAIVLDITERKKMEEQLRREKERYKEIFESMANIVVIIQNEKIIYINKQFDEATGYRTEEVINKPFVDFVHPDMRDIVLANYRRRMRGENAPNHYVIKLLSKDHREIWMDIRATLISWEGGKADLISMVDITYMKEMEDKLMALDEIARMLKMAKSKEEIYEIALDNLYKVLKLYNSAILEIRGDELVLAKARGYTNKNFRVKISSERGITAWVVRNKLPYYSPNTDKDKLYIEGVKGAKCEYAAPISIGDRIYGVLDVQKEEPYSISEDDIKLIDMLANNMAVALRGLENQEQLERAKSLQELMLHIVSHDLKNPLAVLSGYVDIMREDFNPEYLDAMQMAIEEASNIIEKARLFSKLGAGKIDQERELVNLRELVEKSVSLLSHKYPEGRVKIEVGDIEIYAFPLLGEVFVNLIDNAFKYGASEVIVSCREDDEHVEIRVADDGPGIPDERKERIFDAFETLSTKKGSGLGLSIVRMIVELHNGKIFVEDNKPKGSVFVIQLPKD